MKLITKKNSVPIVENQLNFTYFHMKFTKNFDIFYKI